jgi:hypothetical protein
MTAPASGRPSALTWITGVLAVLVLYVLTLPPLLYFAATHFSGSPRVGDFMRWYAAPYGWLVEKTPLRAPLVSYADFWRRELGYNPIFP